MKRKSSRKQDIARYIITLLSIILLLYISNSFFFRIDLTSEKIHTLSPQTKELLKELDDIVYIEIYLEGEIPIGFKKLQKATKEMLDELRVYAKENIQYKFINPSETTDKKERQRIFKSLLKRGLNPTNLQEKDKEGKISQKIIFPGAIINFGDKEYPVDLLQNNPGLPAEVNLNNSIQALEFKIIDAIHNLTNKKKRNIAFIEGHGEFNNLQVMDITNYLSKYYQVDRGAIGGKNGVLDDYEAIIVAQPLKRFTDADKFVIDQYIMNGGKVLWLIDPVQIDADSLTNGATTMGLIKELNLMDMLFKYGVRINPVLIKDLQCSVVPINIAPIGQPASFKAFPWWYYPLLIPTNNHPVSRNINLVKSEFTSYIDTVGHNKKIKKTIILTSSKFSKVLNSPIIVSLNEINTPPEQKGFNKSFLPVGVLLEGRFPSSFTNLPVNKFIGKPSKKFMQESSLTKMIVLADGDIIKNEVTFKNNRPQVIPLGYDRATRQTFGNREFILNAINYLTDDKGIIQLRSKDIKLRLLNRSKLLSNRLKWQLINVIVPLLLVLLAGFIGNKLRKSKYAN